MKFLIRNKKQCVLAKPFESNHRDTENISEYNSSDYIAIPLNEIADFWIHELWGKFELIIVKNGCGFQDLYVIDSFSSREEGERNMKVLRSTD